MLALELDARVRVLEFLHRGGMDATFARALDSAAAQYAQGDLDEYTLFASLCLKQWRQNRDAHLTDVVARVVGVASPPDATAPERAAAQAVQGAVQAAVQGAGQGTMHSAVQGAVQNAAQASEHAAAAAQAKAETDARETRRKAMRTHQSICPKCKSQEFTTLEYERQRRAADEGGEPMRKCENPKCGYKWRVRGVEVNEKRTK